MVPFKRIHDFVGLNELEGFLEYWFSVRSFEAVTLKGLPDFFGEFNDLDGRGLVLRRSARVSTMVNTAIHSIWAKSGGLTCRSKKIVYFRSKIAIFNPNLTYLGPKMTF